MTKKFKTFIFEREQDIQASGLYNAQTLDEAYEIIESINGARIIGNGFFSHVFSGSDGDKVIKLTNSNIVNSNRYDPWFKDWAPFCQQNSFRNFHLPKITFLKLFNEEMGHGFAVCEKLYDFGNIDKIFEELKLDLWSTYSSSHSPRTNLKLFESMRYLIKGYNLYYYDEDYSILNNSPIEKIPDPETTFDLQYLNYRLFLKAFSYDSQSIKLFNQIFEELNDLNIRHGATVDLHKDNFGFNSRGDIVFVDPVS